ncbi:UPAR/Ly6 domain-containing protein crim [Hetaerina americana]|uniref:UPAR/Ly6 domain-containing protein crim n=1 Tax=Hetaerina americana TaxID=62018 RepID=UPI003A7F3E30
MLKFLFVFITLAYMTDTCHSLYCYECVSTYPGCGKNFNWVLHWGIYCPEYNDKCVKLIERKGDEETITRACLSSLNSIRTDIPADKYEGCRPAAKDVKLANYVNHSIPQHDVKRDYFDDVNWCFCYFDDRCNSANRIDITWLLGMLFAIPLLLR